MAKRPKPTALKELEGNPGHRPLNNLEPKPPLGTPERPKGMAKVACREWETITHELSVLGLLSVVDGKALGEYCKLVGLSEIYYRATLKEPMVEEVIVNKMGDVVGTKLVKNPALAAYLNCSKLAKSYLIEFGLTPASRSKLKIQPPKEVDDPMDALMKRPVDTAKQVAPLHFDTGAAKSGTPDLSQLSTDFDA